MMWNNSQQKRGCQQATCFKGLYTLDVFQNPLHATCFRTFPLASEFYIGENGRFQHANNKTRVFSKFPYVVGWSTQKLPRGRKALQKTRSALAPSLISSIGRVPFSISREKVSFNLSR